MQDKTPMDVHTEVRDHYGKVARGETCGTGCCGGASCSTDGTTLGYSDVEQSQVPEGANMGLGCGNPQAIASLQDGETVLDLGSGGGFDAFLAARQVGPTGKVIGVDMTADMLTKARANAQRLGSKNVEFRLGEIENLPVADRSVDVIISNCVINLAPNKQAVFAEALRVLKPGGRMAIMDVVATAPLPESLRSQTQALSGCVSGAAEISEIATLLKSLGFEAVQVEVKPYSAEFIKNWFPGLGAESYVASASIQAVRPKGASCCGTTLKAPCC